MNDAQQAKAKKTKKGGMYTKIGEMYSASRQKSKHFDFELKDGEIWFTLSTTVLKFTAQFMGCNLD